VGGNPRSVVIVDDSEDVRILVAERLRTDGRFTIVGQAGTGKEAVELAAEHQPAALLLDVSLPDIDGWAVLEEILRVAPDTKVAIFSAYDPSALLDRAREAGAADVIDKLVSTTNQLGDRLSALLGGA
jgi:DNA-binding NarL/FixJ family response regulator